MDVLQGLRTYLLAQTAISSLVGTRVYPDVLPQSLTLPAVVMWVIDGVSEEHLQGGSGLARARVQIDAYAATRSEANTISDLIRRRIQGHIGAMSEVVVTGIIHLGGPRYDRDKPRDGSDDWRYITGRDFEIAHTEPTT